MIFPLIGAPIGMAVGAALALPRAHRASLSWRMRNDIKDWYSKIRKFSGYPDATIPFKDSKVIILNGEKFVFPHDFALAISAGAKTKASLIFGAERSKLMCENLGIEWGGVKWELKTQFEPGTPLFYPQVRPILPALQVL